MKQIIQSISMIITGTLLTSLVLISDQLSAQSAPGSDIYLADIAIDNNSLKLGSLVNITQRKGYDNQPCFLADGKHLLFTAEIDGQTDIMLWDLKNNSLSNITNSQESEYSPTPMFEQGWFSVIHATDGKQELWAYQLNGQQRKPLVQESYLIGYHAWIDAKNILVTVLGEKAMSLQTVNIEKNKTEKRYDFTGASLFKIPGTGLMSFNTLIDDQHWLMSFDPTTAKTKPLVQFPKEPRYYTWTPDGKVIIADKGMLWFWDSRNSNSESADNPLIAFASYENACPGGASRIAVNAAFSKLALVCHGAAL